MNEQEKHKIKDIGKNEYLAIHAWLRYKYGPATYCSNKKCSKERQLVIKN